MAVFHLYKWTFIFAVKDYFCSEIKTVYDFCQPGIGSFYGRVSF